MLIGSWRFVSGLSEGISKVLRSTLKLLFESTVLSLYLWFSLPVLLLISLSLLAWAGAAWMWYEVRTFFGGTNASKR